MRDNLAWMQKVQIFFRIYELADQSNCILKKKDFDFEVKKNKKKEGIFIGF